MRARHTKAFILYHPDFVMDENEPKGYRELKTGTWVVEWDTVYTQNTIPKTKIIHRKKSFLTKTEANKFYSQILKNIDTEKFTRAFNRATNERIVKELTRTYRKKVIPL